MPGSESHRDGRKPKSMASNYSYLDALMRFWERSYAADYLGLALLLTAYFLIQFFIDPFHKMFRLDDPRIAFPHAEEERVPVCKLDHVHETQGCAVCQHSVLTIHMKGYYSSMA